MSDLARFMNKRILFIPLAFLLMLVACDSTPDQEELKAIYQGTYCTQNYKLELREDGTYMNSRVSRGFLSGLPMLEKCTGTYEFVFDETAKTWTLNLVSDGKNPNPMINCEGSIKIWEKETGYVQDTAAITLNEIIDQTEVTAAQCDEI